MIQHIGKADRENMQQRVIGSTGIVAACRASFCLFNDKKAGRRIFAPMKNNLAVEPTSVVFTIESTVDGGQVHITDCQYEKNADDIANEMKEACRQSNVGRIPNELSDAENWLRGYLSDGRKPAGNKDNPAPGSVRYESKRAGHSWATIRRAQKQLNVNSKKVMGVSYWSLPNVPDSADQVAQNTISENQVAQNAPPATDGKEQQTSDPVGNSGQQAHRNTHLSKLLSELGGNKAHTENPVGNRGDVVQNAHIYERFEQVPIYFFLGSNLGPGLHDMHKDISN